LEDEAENWWKVGGKLMENIFFEQKILKFGHILAEILAHQSCSQETVCGEQSKECAKNNASKAFEQRAA